VVGLLCWKGQLLLLLLLLLLLHGGPLPQSGEALLCEGEGGLLPVAVPVQDWLAVRVWLAPHAVQQPVAVAVQVWLVVHVWLAVHAVQQQR